MGKVMKAEILVSKQDQSREEWLEYRRKGIGGSDSATIVGMNPYATPFSLWAEKCGLLPEKEDTEAMRIGRDLEPYVVKRFKEYMAEQDTPKRIKECNYILRHPKYPWMLANVDRLIVGERAGLECKTTATLNLKQFKNGDYPDRYYTQCVHYMAVTGAERWYLAILVLGKGFFTFVIERDEAEIDALIQEEKAFWEQVESGKHPDYDGQKPTTEAIGQMYRGKDDIPLELRNRSEIEMYLALKAQIEALELEKGKHEQAIKNELKDALYGSCGAYRVSWVPQIRRTFDASKFREAYPEIDLNEFYRESNSRPFLVKLNKEKERK